MLKVDEAALVCDMAETYSIYNWRALPLSTAALLACGLRENSRIMRKLSGSRYPDEILMQALILDRLNTLIWFQTADGQKGRNRPESVLRS